MNKAWVEGVPPIYRTSVLLRPASKCEVEIKTRMMKKGHSDISKGPTQTPRPLGDVLWLSVWLPPCVYHLLAAPEGGMGVAGKHAS